MDPPPVKGHLDRTLDFPGRPVYGRLRYLQVPRRFGGRSGLGDGDMAADLRVRQVAANLADHRRRQGGAIQQDGHGLFHLIHHPPHAPMQDEPLRGQFAAVVAAFEQHRVETRLEFGDGLADRRLRQADGIGGLADPAGAAHRIEQDQSSQTEILVHRRPPFARKPRISGPPPPLNPLQNLWFSLT